MTHLTGRLAAVSIFVLAPIAVLIARMTWGTEIPDPLPTHWDAHGQVNGTMAASTFFWICLIISIGLAIVGAVSVMSRQVDRSSSLVGAVAFGSWLMAAIYAQVLYVARGADDANGVSLPWQAAIVLLVVGVAAAVAVMTLLPGAHREASPATREPTMQLEPQERATWVGTAQSRVLSIVAFVCALAAAGTAFVSWVQAAILLAVAIVSALMHAVTVRVDEDGVHTLWGSLSWPRSTVPLGEITAAYSQEIDPSKWGGWGYRRSRRGRAAVVRKGPGLVVERSGQPTYMVTVDHADDAAEVLNALLTRHP